MPSTTFQRLPAEKQNKITNAALLEFSQRTFEQATITSICQRAKIPRITLYTYFDSLDDIYIHVYSEIESLCYEEMNYFSIAKDHMLQYFCNIARSPKGLALVAKNIESELPRYRILAHIILSLAHQMNHGVLTMDQYEYQLNELIAYWGIYK